MAEDNGKRSPSWGKWQVIIGIIALIVAIVFGAVAYFQAFESRRMRVVVLADQSLIEVADSISSEVMVTYDGQPVDNLTSVRVRIENGGNRAIVPSDFIEPLAFVFPESAIILRSEVAETNPASFEPKVTFVDNVATIENTLWNGGGFRSSGDRAIIEFIVVDVPESEDGLSFAVSSRITDVRYVEVTAAIDESVDVFSWVPWAAIFFSGVLLIATGTLLLRRLLEQQTEQSTETIRIPVGIWNAFVDGLGTDVAQKIIKEYESDS